MKTFSTVLAVLTLAVAGGVTAISQQGPAPAPADLVLRGGRIVTLDGRVPEAQALAAARWRDRRARHGRGHRTFHRTVHAGGRAQRPVRDAGLHRGPRSLHRISATASSTSSFRTRRAGTRSCTWSRSPPRRRSRVNGSTAAAGTRRSGRRCRQPNVEGFPTHAVARQGVAEQPRAADARKRPRVVRQREGDGALEVDERRRRIRPAARS